MRKQIELSKHWYTLKEAAELKGVSYHTLLNRRELQPEGGKADGIVGGRKKWTSETIRNWLKMTDDELLNTAEHKGGTNNGGQS